MTFTLGIRTATIRKMAMLKHLVRKANDWKMVDDGTLGTVGKAKQLKEPPGRLCYLTAVEVQRLLAECKPYLRPIVTVIAGASAGRGRSNRPGNESDRRSTDTV
jgi:hypothetical protein